MRMKVAAFQAPLLKADSSEGLAVIRQRVEQCESNDVAIRCCPEAVLGGLADHGDDPTRFAIAADRVGSHCSRTRFTMIISQASFIVMTVWRC